MDQGSETERSYELIGEGSTPVPIIYSVLVHICTLPRLEYFIETIARVDDPPCRDAGMRVDDRANRKIDEGTVEGVEGDPFYRIGKNHRSLC